MTLRFTFRKHGIVASGARERHRTVIHFRVLFEGQQRVMATVARCRCRNMALGFTASNDTVMASGALFGCATKNAVDVARFARNIFVLPGQREPGREMIEIEAGRN